MTVCVMLAGMECSAVELEAHVQRKYGVSWHGQKIRFEGREAHVFEYQGHVVRSRLERYVGSDTKLTTSAPDTFPATVVLLTR